MRKPAAIESCVARLIEHADAAVDDLAVQLINARRERIVAAAYFDATTGLVWTLPRPHRHCHILDAMRTMGVPRVYASLDNSGFITSRGRYSDRYDAYTIAKAANQLIAREGGYMKGEINPGPELYSEDLW